MTDGWLVATEGVRACLLIAVLWHGCARDASEEAPSTAMRYETFVNGRCQYVITLPRQGVYVLALWNLRSPEWIGSFAACPQVFVHKGTVDDAAKALGWTERVQLETGSRIEVPAGLVRELVEQADRPLLGSDQAEQLARRCFDAGLLPKLLDIDLESFVSSEERGR